ncbi:MAG: bifunctional diaminohydroxyphosphoribosylaminopyrimidine deaminase/5-amino-6-(5-phosphoribosylamino)uracil reductase RibD [Candidatus Omnitrophica bacterium]|nr:bifunctional diaminohydroxyphosphoribosylaminopyrimidine deaminase/5-amino-6-(5-phosphoribosylamino)uracil reductase RibD [Candidatus Omnitrophota bacterium]
MMRRALELAEKGVGWTSPNPMVGAVVCRGEEIVGEGYHPKVGEPHAEPIALDQAGVAAEGASLYVTLEPCAHHGRTPPCLNRVIEAGVSRVVIAMEDPDPRTAGRSIRALQEHGIETLVGVCEQEARQLNFPFISRVTRGRPWVVLKYAMTLDGRIATSTGDSKWISNEASRHFVHDLRRRYRSILVGYRTYLNDDPMLTCTLDLDPAPRQPLRIVYGGREGIGGNSKLASSAKERPVIQVVLEQDIVQNPEGIETVRLNQPILSSGDSVRQFLSILQEREIDSLLIEGGAQTLTTFLEAGVVDEIYSFIAPKIHNEATAISPFMGHGVKPSISETLNLMNVESKNFEGDTLVHGYLNLL